MQEFSFGVFHVPFAINSRLCELTADTARGKVKMVHFPNCCRTEFLQLFLAARWFIHKIQRETICNIRRASTSGHVSLWIFFSDTRCFNGTWKSSHSSRRWKCWVQMLMTLSDKNNNSLRALCTHFTLNIFVLDIVLPLLSTPKSGNR